MSKPIISVVYSPKKILLVATENGPRRVRLSPMVYISRDALGKRIAEYMGHTDDGILIRGITNSDLEFTDIEATYRNYGHAKDNNTGNRW